ncbi:MAG: hypothetical protein E7224_02360 [Clostridiales bacterium]|nr:hypothetical protein [Clostridiales bacterium]
MVQAGEISSISEDFLAAFSHEIRGALSLLSGSLCVLQMTELSGAQKELTRKMEKASSLLLSLSNNILDLNRLREGKEKLHPTTFLLDDVLEDIDLLFRDKVQDKGLLWECIPSYPSGLTITADRTRLMQILTNLLNNACKFTDHGLIRLRIALFGPQSDERIFFEVEDTGIGISPEDLGNLFREYYQADNSLTRLHVGSGLGLCVAKRLAQAMQGDLSVSSTPGRGSSFAIHIPLVFPQEVLANPA